MPERRTKHAVLKIGSWNVNGIRCKKIEVEQLLADYEPDILALQETKCPPGFRINFLNYRTFRFDRPNPVGGGVAILVKRSLESDLLGDNDGEIEAMGVREGRDGTFTYRGAVRLPFRKV